MGTRGRGGGKQGQELGTHAAKGLLDQTFGNRVSAAR